MVLNRKFSKLKQKNIIDIKLFIFFFKCGWVFIATHFDHSYKIMIPVPLTFSSPKWDQKATK